MRIRCSLLAMVAFLVGGCAMNQTRTYEVSVKNQLARPITIWLTKDGPPAEAGWKSPEHLSMEVPGQEERIPGIVVPPGKTANTGAVKGQFAPETHGVLRVYGGQLTFSQILAVSRGSTERLDVVLHPGPNAIVIEQREGRISAAVSGGEK